MITLEIVKSFLFGMTVGIAVGPIGILIIYHGMQKGMRAGSLCGLGASLGDFTFALLAFFASSDIIQPIVENRSMITRFSSWLLIFFGFYMIIKAAVQGSQKSELKRKSRLLNTENYVSMTYILTLMNPLTIVLFIGFAGQNVQHVSVTKGILFSAFIFLGNIIVQLGLSFFGKVFGRMLRQFQISKYLSIFSGILIVLFGTVHLINW